MKNITIAFLTVAAVAVAADPALAQFAGADPGFRQPLQTVLGWILLIGGVIAVACFLIACIGAFFRNWMAFGGGVLGVIIGGVLMANAPTIVSSLTRLQVI